MDVFSKGAKRGRGEREAEIRDLHVKTGELTPYSRKSVSGKTGAVQDSLDPRDANGNSANNKLSQKHTVVMVVAENRR